MNVIKSIGNVIVNGEHMLYMRAVSAKLKQGSYYLINSKGEFLSWASVAYIKKHVSRFTFIETLTFVDGAPHNMAIPSLECRNCVYNVNDIINTGERLMHLKVRDLVFEELKEVLP